MKLRIRGNSVRLRLSQTEMAQIAASGSVEDCVEFSPGSRLSYRLEVKPDGVVAAGYDTHGVKIAIPRSELDRWVQPEAVSIRAEQPLAGDDTLSILVEKDFQCLSPREGEDDSDLFPNPG